jgi:hypothetical protein
VVSKSNEETANSVDVVLNGKSVLSFNYNYLVHDGDLGLFARNGNASFDNLLIRGDDVAYAGGGTPQLAAAPAPAPRGQVAPLTGAELEPIVGAAIARWSALPAYRNDVTRLEDVPFVIADLPGPMLGQTIADTIVIDPTAAGYGWFIDATPRQEEFAAMATGQMRRAIDASPIDGKMDLLTVVMHELGHVLGLGDLDNAGVPDDLMAAALTPGIRRLPDEASFWTESVNSEDRLPGAGKPIVHPVGPKDAPPATSGPRPSALDVAGLSPTRSPSGPPQRLTGSGRGAGTILAGAPFGRQPFRTSDPQGPPEILDAVLPDLYEERPVDALLQGLLGRGRRVRRS